MKKNLTLFLLLLAGTFIIPYSLWAQDTYVTNGNVNAIVRSGNTIYIGGSFTYVGPNTPNGVAINTTTGAPDLSYAKPNGQIFATIPDGSGGWYIGGSFTQVGNFTRNRIAQIDANGAVTAFNPNANNTVSALAVSGSTVYAGGSFTSINSVTRNRIAGLDATTGALTAFNPNANNTVRALAVSGSTVYAGGDFTNIGGATRSKIAALNATTGIAAAFNANASSGSSVNALAVSGSTLYVGGSFTTIGGATRNFIGGVDATTGAVTAFNPNANNTVSALAVSGSTVYAGGNFTSIGFVTRNRIAALDATTGALTAINPNANGTVFALAVSGSTVYAGGAFTTIGGAARDYFAALDAITGAPLPIQLLHFASVNRGNTNLLSWSTALETAGIRFDVERSANGSAFTVLGTVNSTGRESTYTYSDEKPLSAINYYRLKMTERSGETSYSNVAIVRNSAKNGAVTVAPVPATDNLSITNTDAGLNGLPAGIYSMEGRLMIPFTLEAVNTVNISSWPAGVYVLRLPVGEVVRLVKQ